MDIEYDITREDLYAFQWRAAYRSSRGRRTRGKVYLYVLLAVLLFAAMPAIGSGGFAISQVNFLFVAIFFPAFAIPYWFLEKRLMHRAIMDLLKQERPDKGQLGTHRIVLSTDGVFESTAVGESRTSWAGIDRVEANEDYIFIYTSPAAAHMIPKRAFRAVEDAERFYQLARTSKATVHGSLG